MGTDISAKFLAQEFKNILNSTPVCLYEKDAIAINNFLDKILCYKKIDFSDDELRAILNPLRRAIKKQSYLETVEMRDTVCENDNFYCPYCGAEMSDFSLMSNLSSCNDCYHFYTTNACWERTDPEKI